MNQIIPKSALKITAGGEPGNYKYTGDSGTYRSTHPHDTHTSLDPGRLTCFDPGKSVNCYYCPKCTSHIYHHQVRLRPR